MIPYAANIKDLEKFPQSFFRSFRIVFNALDNLEARRHVNKLCLVGDVPLIESGTTGFNGQVQAIRKAHTECYDCTEKVVPKSYPVCTIRSTPSQPIHSIVWAKSYLLPELFGDDDDNASEQFDHSEDAENSGEIETLRQEAQALKKIRDEMDEPSFVGRIFNKVFKEDIERLRGMEGMWTTRQPPKPLDFATLQPQVALTPLESLDMSDQKKWNLAENFLVFESSLLRLRHRAQQAALASSRAPRQITFDKDDLDTLSFVTAASNLRSHTFSIPSQSQFTVKQMAGNIIPAVATTNAMIAGLCVMQAFKVLRGDFFRAKTLFLETNGARVINSEPPRLPKPDCPVCSVAMATMVIDPERAELKDLVNDVLRGELGYGEELTVMNEVGPIYDPDMDDMLTKKFAELGVTDKSFLTVVDDDESEGDPRVNLQLTMIERKCGEGDRPVTLLAPEPLKDANVLHDEFLSPTAREKASLNLKIEIPRAPKKTLSAQKESQANDSRAALTAITTTNGAGSGSASVATSVQNMKRSADQAGLENTDTLRMDVAVNGVSVKNTGGNAESPVSSEPTQVILLDDQRNGHSTTMDDGAILIED